MIKGIEYLCKRYLDWRFEHNIQFYETAFPDKLIPQSIDFWFQRLMSSISLHNLSHAQYCRFWTSTNHHLHKFQDLAAVSLWIENAWTACVPDILSLDNITTAQLTLRKEVISAIFSSGVFNQFEKCINHHPRSDLALAFCLYMDMDDLVHTTLATIIPDFVSYVGALRAQISPWDEAPYNTWKNWLSEHSEHVFTFNTKFSTWSLFPSSSEIVSKSTFGSLLNERDIPADHLVGMWYLALKSVHLQATARFDDEDRNFKLPCILSGTDTTALGRYMIKNVYPYMNCIIHSYQDDQDVYFVLTDGIDAKSNSDNLSMLIERAILACRIWQDAASIPLQQLDFHGDDML